MKALLVLLFALATVTTLPLPAEEKKAPPAKADGKIKYEGGDGSSMEKAVIIKGAKGSEDGIAAEYEWLAKKHRGYKTKQQALLNDKGRKYDMIAIATADGKEVEVYFDITEFFGKF